MIFKANLKIFLRSLLVTAISLILAKLLTNYLTNCIKFSHKMKSLLNFLIIASVTFTATTLVDCNQPELEIHNTFKPEQCNRKAKVTDVLTLHYKGALENGQVFDSR